MSLKTTAMVAKLGDFFGKTLAEKNAWKKRMLIAGTPKGAISFPEDFDDLSEEEKEKRLDGAIKMLADHD